MTKIKLDLKNLNAADTVNLANAIKTAMTGNANFATPVPALAAVGTAITNLQTAIANKASSVALDKQRTIEQSYAVGTLDDLLTQLGAYAIATVNGDAAKLASAGFPIASTNSGSSAMPQVHNLSATTGDNDSEIDLHWDKIKNAHSYEIQRCDDPPVDANYANSVTCTETKRALTGLTSGTKMWFRVRAIGGNGPGPWSDPATKMVP
jgi:hypothetical protein